MNATRWTVNAIKEAVRATGSHWFDPDTMRFFGTRVHSAVYQGPGGIFFVTQDKAFDDSRAYTVREFDPDRASIDTTGELCGHKTRKEAHDAAKEAAGEGLSITAEEYREISPLAQFLHDLKTHGATADKTDARHLIRLAAKHHKLMEQLCNGEIEYDAEGENPQVADVRQETANRAEGIGCKGVVFSGDPRGATVKLVFHDGETNDWGKEGWIVPTSETPDTDEE